MNCRYVEPTEHNNSLNRPRTEALGWSSSAFINNCILNELHSIPASQSVIILIKSVMTSRRLHSFHFSCRQIRCLFRNNQASFQSNMLSCKDATSQKLLRRETRLHKTTGHLVNVFLMVLFCSIEIRCVFDCHKVT